MAKRKKDGINVSEAIREYLKKSPDEGATAVAAALTTQLGKTVSPAQVSNIKAKQAGGSTNRSNRGDAKTAVYEFVLFENAGNIGKALKAVEDFAVPEKTALEKFIDSVGGKSRAISHLQSMKDQQSK